MDIQQPTINIILIAAFTFLSVFVFLESGQKIKSDISEGEIFNIAGQPISALEDINILEVDMKKEEKESVSTKGNDLEEILLYSKLSNVPEVFIGRKTENKDIAQFHVLPIHENTNITAAPKTIKKQKAKVIPAKPKQGSKPPSKKESKKELDFSVLNKAISDSTLTFFYPYNFETLDDVSAGIVSITPYEEDQHIIKFKIKNDTSNFFIVSNISLKNNGKQVLAKRYFDNVVGKKSDKHGILVTPKFTSGSVVSITFLENGGKNRTFKINIKIP